MLDVGKPCTQTIAGALGVPQRREKTLTSLPPLAAVDDCQRSSVPPLCHSSKMSINSPPVARSAALAARPLRRPLLGERAGAFLRVGRHEQRRQDLGLRPPHLLP